MRSGIRYSRWTKLRACVLYARKGWNVPRISFHLGPSTNLIRAWLREMDVPLRGASRRFDRVAILNDIKLHGVAEAARIHGCSPRFASDLNTGKVKP